VEGWRLQIIRAWFIVLLIYVLFNRPISIIIIIIITTIIIIIIIIIIMQSIASSKASSVLSAILFLASSQFRNVIQ